MSEKNEWKLVPVVPTDDMEAAAEDDYEQTGATFPRWKSAYAAMLAAAPSAPGDAQDERQAFEAWAEDQGFVLDCDFFEVSGQYYDSDDTQLAYDIWRAARASAPAAGDAQTDAARDVLAERQRQISAEGFSTERDDGYTNLELADAGAQYALRAGGWSSLNVWPWKPDTFKEGTPREMLVKAGALILAEIERLDRAALSAQPTTKE